MLLRGDNITGMLQAIRQGDLALTDDLINAVYYDLKKVARRYLAAEDLGHTLQPTAVVNDVFLRLFRPAGSAGEWESTPIDWQSRAHFLGVAAKQMRRLLVDHARHKRAEKRDFGVKIEFENVNPGSLTISPNHDFESLDDSLNALSGKDPEAAQIVELKFFGGLTDGETALVTGLPVITVRRRWEFARAWLRVRLEKSAQRQKP